MPTINGGVCIVNGKPVDTVYSNGVQVYGRNLLAGTSFNLQKATVNSWWLGYTSTFLTHSFDNKTCTACVWIDNPSKDALLQVWTNKQSWNSNTIKANQSGYATVTFKITNTSYTDAHIAIFAGSGLTVTFGYKEMKMEYGEIATPWTPAPEDVGITS